MVFGFGGCVFACACAQIRVIRSVLPRVPVHHAAMHAYLMCVRARVCVFVRRCESRQLTEIYA